METAIDSQLKIKDPKQNDNKVKGRKIQKRQRVTKKRKQVVGLADKMPYLRFEQHVNCSGLNSAIVVREELEEGEVVIINDMEPVQNQTSIWHYSNAGEETTFIQVNVSTGNCFDLLDNSEENYDMNKKKEN